MKPATGLVLTGLVAGLMLATVVVLMQKKDDQEKDPDRLEDNILAKLDELEQRMEALDHHGV